ncbi:MAG TPA: electron-transfer flavoprotein:ubiquinone oxidoreductase [Candidatus Manganitrophaceae bacterium]|nr:electron-transfer flavoprotein:ubiquinone oxidoreductase [Candidatus Manganitrophaceae bacterium]
MTPSEFPPPVRPGEFISPITAAPENRIEVGVLFVGAGPANLAGAIRLAQLLEHAPEVKASLGEFPIAVIEKGKYPGGRLLAGAILNPVSLRRLFPELKEGAFPLENPVREEALYLLSERRAFRAPLPPTMRNRGNYAVSLSRLGRWLAERAEGLGVTLFNETSGVRLLVESGAVRGVKTGDKGRDRSGAPLENFQEGAEILAKATVLGEGAQGHLTQAALAHFGVSRPQPQTYSLGVKEIWETPRPMTRVIHTMGWPLRGARSYNEFGGSFLYPMGENKVSLGLVVGLGYRDASTSVHDLLQLLKTHPFVKNILEGGQRLSNGWGAKTLPEGGYYALPDRLSLPGALLVGDAAGFLNVPALKGIHYAIASGTLAAEAIFAALKEGRNLGAPEAFQEYDRAVLAGFIGRDLYRVRNIRQAFNYGFVPGVLMAGLMTMTRGVFPGWRFEIRRDAEEPLFLGERGYPAPDGKYIFDKLSSVHASGNAGRDNQPNHLRVETRVPEVIGEAWIHICPANVYEWGTGAQGEKVIRMNPTNCIQCGAIGAKGGRLTPPEGGSGPQYTET